MSYILDALRRAQAERSRGSVPDLHTPATPVAASPAVPGPALAGAPWLLVAVLAAAALAGAGWWAGRATPAPPESLALRPPPGLAPSAPSVASPAAAPAPAHPPTPPAPPEPVPTAAPAPRAPSPAGADRPTSRPREREAAAAPARSPAPAPRPAPAKKEVATQKPAPADPTARARGTVFAPADLPPAVRAQLPTLQIAGITFSANPRHRMAIVNGQVLHEGEQAAPGLVLERIEQSRTVWAFQGYRYALGGQ